MMMKTKNMLPMTEEIIPLTRQESGYLTGGFIDESIDQTSPIDPTAEELGNFICVPVNTTCKNDKCNTYNYSAQTCA